VYIQQPTNETTVAAHITVNGLYRKGRQGEPVSPVEDRAVGSLCVL
jgi:hypothetical protein